MPTGREGVRSPIELTAPKSHSRSTVVVVPWRRQTAQGRDRVGIALRGGHLIPLRRLIQVLYHTAAFLVHRPQIGLGNGKVLLCRQAILPHGFARVPLDDTAAFKHVAQVGLAISEILIRKQAIQSHRPPQGEHGFSWIWSALGRNLNSPIRRRTNSSIHFTTNYRNVFICRHFEDQPCQSSPVRARS